MTKVSDLNENKFIRLGHWLNLIFFALLFLSCDHENSHDILLNWHNNKPVSVSVPFSLIQDSEEDFIQHNVRVTLLGSETPILGEIHFSGNHLRFTPSLPFERGSNYTVYYHQKKVASFHVPSILNSKQTEVLQIYPTTDTIPENTLKLYLSFSAPMREGNCISYLSLLTAKNDTVADPFLRLEPELWNEDRTVLTVWLDPGRIKRGLSPNQKSGNPLHNGEHYMLVIDKTWRDATGRPLHQTATKRFVVAGRDSLGPQPGSWTLFAPSPLTRKALTVSLHEKLDHYLLEETISIYDESKSGVKGTVSVESNDSRLSFIPENPWKPGTYFLRVASYLEDLAGNNLNRPFDRDITTTPLKNQLDFIELPFIVSSMP